MSRILLAAVAALLVFAPAARADFVVTTASPTSDPVVTFTSDPGDVLTCRVGLGAFAPCTSPWRPELTGDGTYDVEVADDHYGSVVRHITVDRTPPSLAFTGGPADGSTQVARDATFTFSVDDANLDWVACSASDAVVPCAGTFALEGLSPGTHTVVITAADKAGNQSKITRTFTVATAQTIVDPGPKPPASEGGVLSTTASKASVHLSVAKRSRRFTRLRSISLRNVPAGAAVKVSCKGASCPRKPTLRSLTDRDLRPGTRITITLPRQTITITIRATKPPLVR